MRPSSLLRTISSKLPARFSPPPVAPWPPVRTVFDDFLISELDNLQQCSHSLTSSSWLRRALDIAITAQRMSAMSLRPRAIEIEKKSVEKYYKESADLLDACNCLRERIHVICSYLRNVESALHWLEFTEDIGVEPNNSLFRKAVRALECCEEDERKFVELEKTKKFDWWAPREMVAEPEAFIGAGAVAMFVVGVFDAVFTFKGRRRLEVTLECERLPWMHALNEVCKQVKDEVEKRRKGGGVVLDEVRELVLVVKALRELVCLRVEKGKECGREKKKVMDLVRRRCGELKEMMEVLEERVDELYRELIGVRMVFLERFA
ncbi:hypothetical protein DsansV1_C18g0153761 [Dioscorea sansibarensis]